MIRKKAKSIKKLFSNSSLRSKKVIINIIGLTGVKIIDVLIGIFMVPLSIEYLGQNEYGIWLTLTSMVLWFNFFNGGLGHGLRNKLAENIAIGDFKKAKQYVSLTYFILVSILALNGCGGAGSDVINSIAAPQTSSPPSTIL